MSERLPRHRSEHWLQCWSVEEMEHWIDFLRAEFAMAQLLVTFNGAG